MARVPRDDQEARDSNTDWVYWRLADQRANLPTSRKVLTSRTMPNVMIKIPLTRRSGITRAYLELEN
jgi:hypothetical protein